MNICLMSLTKNDEQPLVIFEYLSDVTDKKRWTTLVIFEYFSVVTDKKRRTTLVIFKYLSDVNDKKDEQS